MDSNNIQKNIDKDIEIPVRARLYLGQSKAWAENVLELCLNDAMLSDFENCTKFWQSEIQRDFS